MPTAWRRVFLRDARSRVDNLIALGGRSMNTRQKQRISRYQTVRSACPECRGPLHRTSRRPIDRLTSQFTPVYRYRCEGFGCGWEGNLRVAREDFDVTDARLMPLSKPALQPKNDALPLSFVISTSLALAGSLAVVLFGVIGPHESQGQVDHSVVAKQDTSK